MSQNGYGSHTHTHTHRTRAKRDERDNVLRMLKQIVVDTHGQVMSLSGPRIKRKTMNDNPRKKLEFGRPSAQGVLYPVKLVFGCVLAP